MAVDAERAVLQSQVQAALNVVTNPRANKATGHTDGITCALTNSAPTACLKEVINQHEHVHRSACLQHRRNALSLFERHRDLAEYAREEIESYRSELAYVHGALSNLEHDCRLALEFRSEIDSKVMVVTSSVQGDIALSIAMENGRAAGGLSGNDVLAYDTRDLGPPKGVKGGRRILACYFTVEGKGKAAFDVTDGWLMREKTPPYGPLIELKVGVGQTQETWKSKGPDRELWRVR